MWRVRDCQRRQTRWRPKYLTPLGDREDMRRDDDDRHRRGVRNGGPSFDRFNTEYLDQASLSEFRSNEPKFELDHLATFAAGTRNGVIHAEDGLRKLRQMENTTGIWTMRCVLIVERGCLVILDNSTGAQEIVDEILAAKNGQQRLYPPGGGSKIPPPPVGPAPELPYDFQGMRDFLGESRQYNQFNQTNYSQSGQFGGPVGQQRSFITRVGGLREKEDYTGGSTEILERDVQLLNHCFDDIEKFVARLQQAAESYKELEKRKRDRRGARNNKRQSGDGMLNARARPPPDRDFVDIFQKFKLSFNLLAKLKAHIHDPNAPELVHFLFTPLSLIYEASRDPFHGNQNLGDQAVAPVLTADAKQLLNNCLTTKEVELWQALGKHWTTSRDEWNGHIPPYVPEFYDGWQPAATILDDMTARSLLNQPIPDPVMMRPPPPPLDDRGPPPRPMPFPEDDRPPFRNNIMEDTFDRNLRNDVTRAVVEKPPKPPTPRPDENAAYFEELRRMGDVTIYEAAHARIGKNDRELTVEKGDILQVLDSSRNWWKLRNHKGQVGFAPYTILKPVKTDPDYDRSMINGGSMPMSYRSDNYFDDNSSRRGASRRDSDIQVFYDESDTDVHKPPKVATKPAIKPRRGSEPATAKAHRSSISDSQDVRSRSKSVFASNQVVTDDSLSIIKPRMLQSDEAIAQLPQIVNTRRINHPQPQELQVDSAVLADLAFKVAARSRAASSASARTDSCNTSSDQSLPASPNATPGQQQSREHSNTGK
ncbi:epidermal growth factor receptor kinase substrate 8, partial [Plakobranchus ocellatus]